MKQVKVGELLIPADYWDLTETEKMDLCLTVMDSMLIILDKHILPEYDRMDVLDTLLQSSIIFNEENDNFEVTDLMYRIRKVINEEMH